MEVNFLNPGMSESIFIIASHLIDSLARQGKNFRLKVIFS